MISSLTTVVILTLTGVVRADLELFEPENTQCNESSINYNILFKHGHQAGRFQKVSKTKDMASCIGKCCETRDCDVAFMSLDNCYMVDCKNIKSCVTKHLKRPKYETMMSFVSRSNRNRATFAASQDGEPAVVENLQENVPTIDHPLIFKTSKQNDKTANLKQITSENPRDRRSEAIDVVLAVGASILAIAAAIIGVATMMRILVDRGGRSRYGTIK